MKVDGDSTAGSPVPMGYRLAWERGTRFALVRYLVIGSVVAAIDITTFQTLLHVHASLVAATTLAYVVAVCLHFTLNKYLNFRSIERSTIAQAQTYAIVVAFSWALTIAIVTAMTRTGLPPVVGKVASIAANVPFGFLCHRFLTFGPGIRKTMRRRHLDRS